MLQPSLTKILGAPDGYAIFYLQVASSSSLDFSIKVAWYFCEKIAFVLVLLYVMAIRGKKNLFRVGNWAFE